MIVFDRLRVDEAAEAALLVMAANAETDAALGLRLPYRRAVMRLAREAADPRSVVLVARNGDRLVGLLVGRLERILFLEEQQVRVLYFYVEPEHRRGIVAARILHLLLAWTRRRRAAAIVGELGGQEGAKALRAILASRGIAASGDMYRFVF